MRSTGPAATTGGLLAVIAVVACHAASGQAPPASPTDSARPPLYGAADVRFMQGMITHHAQALAMVALIADHSTREAMRLLGKRIEISQRDEIGLMRHWLSGPSPGSADRGCPAYGVDARHADEGGMLMPGMLTPEQMDQLAKAKGPEFDRLFLEGMIRHHEGALTMVSQFFGTNGAGQEAEMFRFASDVDADQRAEIQRMRAMLDAMTEARGQKPEARDSHP